MNRNDEYNELLEELEETPLKLDFTLDRAKLKRKEHKRRLHRAVFAPLGTIAAVFAVFVFLVNISPTFAYAAGRVPLLRELAQFVAMSPSLSAAVENEYVQPVDLVQARDGICARVEYLIVDQKQLNIFYTLTSDTYPALTADPSISSAGGGTLEGFSVVYGNPAEESDELRKITVDFPVGNMPDALTVTLRVQAADTPMVEASAPPAQSDYGSSLFEDSYTPPEQICELSFTLVFDPNFTDKGEILELNRDFVLDGQKLTLLSAKIYPTHMRFIFDDTESNTAWMTGLEFYVENEKGKRFEGITNGISAYGKADSPMMQQFMLESAFFSGSEHLTLFITRVLWLDKDMERVKLDLAEKTAEALPEGVEFVSARKIGDGWLLEFTASAFKENFCHQIWSDGYFDAQGNRYDYSTYSFTSVGSSYSEEKTDDNTENEFCVMLPLKDYPYDEVWLRPAYSRSVTLDTPISIEIK